MATNQLAIYNIALLAIGERALTALTDDVHSRHLLDEVWDRGAGALEYILEQGYWHVAIRSAEIDKSSSITPAFGFQNAFDVPSDFIRLVQISGGEFFSDPLMNFDREAQYWYANVDPIFIRYVSDHTSYGTDLSLWPETLTLYAGYYLATQIAPSMTNDIDLESLEKRTRIKLNDARSKDAQQEPTRFPPFSAWNRARGSGGSWGDRGTRSQLIG